MKYMVLETFRPGCRERVYERFREKGRMLPDGLRYIDSWVEQDGSRCFQLMETDSPELFEQWTAAWNDLVSFEIILIENSSTSNAAENAKEHEEAENPAREAKRKADDEKRRTEREARSSPKKP
jgi:Protein of unknown function (DUF3303)